MEKRMEKLKLDIQSKVKKLKGEIKMAVMPIWMSKILEEEEFDKYHAFFEIFQHNHNQQGVVAIAHLGASHDRTKKMCKSHHERGGLIPYKKDEEYTQRTEIDVLKSDNIDDYLGQNVGYYKILEHFRKIYKSKYGKNIKKLIREELPPIVDGPLAGAFHGIIQVGYGYAGKSDMAVLQGIAWVFQQYSPVQPKDKSLARDISQFGKGTRDILDVIKEIREDKEMADHIDKVSESNEEHKIKYPNNWFDWRSITIVEDYSDRFLQLTDSIQLPEFFNPQEKNMEQVDKLIEWFQDMATICYVRSDFVNNLFFLHAITSSWSLRQVITLLDYDSAVMAIRAQICAVLITYLTIKSPGLNKEPGDYWKGDKIDQAAWDKVIEDTLAKDFDHHVFKLVQILYEAWREDTSGPLSHMYIAGARISVDQGFNASPFPFDGPVNNYI